LVIEGVEPGSPAKKAGLKGRRRHHSGERTTGESGNGPGNPDCNQLPFGSKVKLNYIRDARAERNRRRRWKTALECPDTAGRNGDRTRQSRAGEFGLARRTICSRPWTSRPGMTGKKGVMVTENRSRELPMIWDSAAAM